MVLGGGVGGGVEGEGELVLQRASISFYRNIFFKYLIAFPIFDIGDTFCGFLCFLSYTEIYSKTKDFAPKGSKFFPCTLNHNK